VSTPLIVVLTIGIGTTLLLIVFMMALFRQLKSLATSLRQYRDEVQPLLEQIQRASKSARTRAEDLPARLPSREAGARLRRSS
jgi:predicted PurR-regulated permease PerM